MNESAESAIVVIEPLSKEQATALILEIKTNWSRASDYYAQARKQLLEFDQRRGWEVLGYSSLGDSAELFGWSYQHIYRLRKRAEDEINLLGSGDEEDESPVGDTPTGRLPLAGNAIPHLTKLPTVEAQRLAHQRAQQMATAEGQTRVTERHAAKAAAVVSAEIAVQDVQYPVLQHMFTAGEVTAEWVARAAGALNRLDGRTVAAVVQLVAKGLGKADVRLIEAVGEDFKREETTNPSRTLKGILATGTVAQVPFAQATMSDYGRAKREAAALRRAEEEEAQLARQAQLGRAPVRQHVITIYEGDPARTLKELRKVLPERDLRALQMLLEVA